MKTAAILLFVLAIASPVLSQSGRLETRQVALEGTITDLDNGTPIERVTVRVIGSNVSTLSNSDGRYRLLLQPGEWELHFSHVAYRTATANVAVDSGGTTLDIALERNVYELKGATVYERAYDPAQEIILQAIARKRDILNQLADYSYDAYTKVVVTDLEKQGAEGIFLIAESQTTAYWEQPDKYKEIITARRQSGNIDAENNLVSVGQILNFNANRIDLGQYSLVTPTATDALNSYNYYLIDTVYLDGRTVFRLEIEPRSNADPLFVGTIDIADSTFDVVAVDIGVNDAVRFPFIDSLRYSQSFALFNNEFWMPIDIRFGAQVHLGIKFPGIPQNLGVSQVASLYSYSFERGHRKGLFDEYVIEVEPRADDIDSAAWDSRQTIPLTVTETDAYQRIDSIEALPPSFREIATAVLFGTVLLATVGYPDLFHFNRAEGYYLGLGGELTKLSPDVSLRVKSGYSFGREQWQHEYGGAYRLNEDRRLWVGGYWRDDIVKRPTVISDPDYNPTFGALGWKLDPFDYYHERGFELFARSKVANYVDASIGYLDARQESAPITSDHSIFAKSEPVIRDNPSIVDGRLRALSASLTFDSRPLMRNKGYTRRIETSQRTSLTIGVEYASPDLIDNDFDYRRYYAKLYARRRMFDMGLTTINAFAGMAEGDLPPQRYFTVDHGNGILFGNGEFSTMDKHNFAGNRAASVFVNHDFDRLLFRKSGLPGIKDIPFTLQIFGGAFWTEFNDHAANTGDEFVRNTGGPYAEAGFGIGNLTPFISPFNLGLFFTWQVSEYKTGYFNWTFGFAF
ncbi:DUF5686 and carboxypeptidase regulatory-like domain-containing protein [bacterium]|nr:DUF5686 and carboxypeptidase regulatory-like domain-containing protein [bacterium]